MARESLVKLLYSIVGIFEDSYNLNCPFFDTRPDGHDVGYQKRSR